MKLGAKSKQSVRYRVQVLLQLSDVTVNPQNIPGVRGTNSHNSNEKEPGAGSNQALHAQCRPSGSPLGIFGVPFSQV